MGPPVRSSIDSPHIEYERVESPRGLLISLAFWMCLLLSVCLYALVVLSPKMIRCARRAEEFARLQQHLCDLRRQVDFGDRLTQEWESNADFRASLTRALSTDGVPGRRRIKVEEALRFQGRPRTAPLAVPSPAQQLPMGVFQAFAGSRLMQAAGLTFATVMLVGAFTFLTDELARLPSLAHWRMRPRRLSTPHSVRDR